MWRRRQWYRGGVHRAPLRRQALIFMAGNTDTIVSAGEPNLVWPCIIETFWQWSSPLNKHELWYEKKYKPTVSWFNPQVYYGRPKFPVLPSFCWARSAPHIPFRIQNFPDAPGRLGTTWSVRVGDYGMSRWESSLVLLSLDWRSHYPSQPVIVSRGTLYIINQKTKVIIFSD